MKALGLCLFVYGVVVMAEVFGLQGWVYKYPLVCIPMMIVGSLIFLLEKRGD